MVLCEPNFGKRLLQPQFITIPPPLYEGPDDEVSSFIQSSSFTYLLLLKLEWLFPSEGFVYDIEWDNMMCQNGIGVTEVQRLYKLALQRKLENDEEQKFKDEIKVLLIYYHK